MVFKSRQLSLDRLVAIKVLPQGINDPETKFAERFKNEARAMARLSHPEIVAVHDFGVAGQGLLKSPLVVQFFHRVRALTFV